MKKRCTKCKEFKNTKDFHKDSRSKDGLYLYCKDCTKIRVLNYRRTKPGLLTSIYSDQIKRSKKRNYKLPSYSKSELKIWLLNQKLFHELYDNWVKSGHSKKLTPSIDRKNDYESYTLNNIQLMTWDENNKKGHIDCINGVNNKLSKAVLQFDLDGNFIAEYYSIHKASIETKANRNHISDVCLNRKGCKTSGGFIWKHKNTNHEQ